MSLRKAINDHCRSCGYDHLSGLGTWRKQIEDCPCTQCCLYPVRPTTHPKRLKKQPKNALFSDTLEQRTEEESK